MRPDWDTTWMTVAEAIAARSKCANRKVGAVIVDVNNRPISVGYNGAPAGFPATSSCTAFCPRSQGERGQSYDNCVSVHAEVNALLFSHRNDSVGGTIYVTSPCCFGCAKAVANSGLSRVVFTMSVKDAHTDNEASIKFLRTCGLQVDVIEEEK